jgi:hypothetical protein
MILHQGAIAVLHAMPNGFSAVLNNGTVVVSSAAGQTFELAADGAVIRPASAQPASAQITMVSPKELLLTGTRGTLTVTMGDEVKSIEAGNSYRMEVDAGDSGPGPAGQGQSPHCAKPLLVDFQSRGGRRDGHYHLARVG